MRERSWQVEVHEWARQATGEALGPLEHVRTEAWSTVWRTTASGQTYWFKENTPALTAEGPVQAVLAQIAPEQVTPPVAWDVDRAWLLTVAGGTVLQDRYPDRRGMDGDAVRAMLGDYAVLQRATVDHRDSLLAAGLPDRSPTTATATLQELASTMAAFAPDDPRHITPDEHFGLQDAVPLLEEAAGVLTSGPVPLAFEHNDLFPRNVFVPRAGEGYRFFDFGESLWAHPFASLVMLEWEVVNRHSLAVGDQGLLDLDHPVVHDVFDAYLQGWRDHADLTTLRRLTAAALQIAPLYRAERWLQILDRIPAARQKHGGNPRAWIFDAERPVRL